MKSSISCSGERIGDKFTTQADTEGVPEDLVQLLSTIIYTLNKIHPFIVPTALRLCEEGDFVIEKESVNPLDVQ